MKLKTKIIEFAGLPKTGKTTVAKSLKEYLSKEKNKKVSVVVSRSSACPIKDKLNPLFNYWTTVSLMKEYLEANDNNIDFLIADRGLIDASIWVKLLSDKIEYYQYLNEFQALKNNFVLDNYLITFFFYSSFEKIIERETERQIISRKGRIMNNETLASYKKYYDIISPELQDMSKIIEIDTTNIKIKDLNNKIKLEIDKILSL